jgi:hypothetical protein
MKVVISQSMYFPWVGMLEQIRLADIFVHYDDVQYARGFYNRVQIKTSSGMKWLTVPLRDQHRGQLINEVRIDDRIDWRGQHRDVLRQAYFKAPFRDEMISLVDTVFSNGADTLADLSRGSMLALADYFNVGNTSKFKDSEQLAIGGSSSQRLHDLCKALGANFYVTGHGAKNYLDHNLFEASDIKVCYMDYQAIEYPQLHGEFTPYLTSLDLVANYGREGRNVICSDAIYWKERVYESL